MAAWAVGQAVIRQMIHDGEVQQVTGAASDGAPYLEKARRGLASARIIAETDPENGFTLAYDAARAAATALLAQQGLRPTQKGGHIAVENAMRAQFGGRLDVFGHLRRRRNELQYPTVIGDEPDLSEATGAIEDVERIIDAATALLPELGMFR